MWVCRKGVWNKTVPDHINEQMQSTMRKMGTILFHVECVLYALSPVLLRHSKAQPKWRGRQSSESLGRSRQVSGGLLGTPGEGRGAPFLHCEVRGRGERRARAQDLLFSVSFFHCTLLSRAHRKRPRVLGGEERRVFELSQEK